MKWRSLMFSALLLMMSGRSAGAHEVKEFLQGYSLAVLSFSTLAAFAMIPASMYLTDEYRNIAIFSQASQGVCYLVAGVLSCAPCDVAATVAVGSLATGTMISQMAGLYTDISLWSHWDWVEKRIGDNKELTRLGWIEYQKAILGGTVANGILHLLPHAGALLLGTGGLILNYMRTHSGETVNHHV